ncbi:haloacid dehalogenase-like hydrolase [Treponema pedis]|uniref:haloacid dehalogenase-like hydrolase n=1 Tax=Treponema pedis TaxID=409322 RepID=UPI0004241072|nr:HAD family hydrolase [Treponema pedis]
MKPITLKKNSILKVLIAALSFAIIIACTTTPSVTENNSVEVLLSKGNWEAGNRSRLIKLINDNTDKNAYAVFDWDFTCIFQDTQESLFRYQIDNLLFKMTPEEFHTAIRVDVPKDNFNSDYVNTDGGVINIETIGADLDADYAYLYKNFSGMKGTKSLEEIKKTEEFKDFRGKLAFLYEAIGGTFSAEIAYPWVLYLFTGMTVDEVNKITEEANDAALKLPIDRYTIESSDTLKGKAGKVSLSGYKQGLRTQPETKNLMQALRAKGIEVYICSASLEDVVRVFASNPKYGYNVKPENVIGMRLEKDANGKYMPVYKKDYPQTQAAGKTAAIKKEIAVKYNGKGPIFVAGDSNGDYDMAVDFVETQLVLIMNRIRKSSDRISKLSKLAVEETGKKDARAILQGRNENEGIFIPSQGSYPFGKKELQVLSTK